MVGRRVGADARDRAIARHRPALAGGLGGNVEEGLQVEPELLASTNASQVATMVAPRIMLLQIFAAWPAPSSPAWITALAIGSRNGRARSNCSSVPPTMKARVPAAAAAMPPETGASTKAKPFASSPRRHRARLRRRWSSNRSAARRLGVGRDVVLDTPRAHACAAGSMVMTTSASLTASAADPAAVQPPAPPCSSASATGRRRGPHGPPWRDSGPSRRPCGPGR